MKVSQGFWAGAGREIMNRGRDYIRTPQVVRRPLGGWQPEALPFSGF